MARNHCISSLSTVLLMLVALSVAPANGRDSRRNVPAFSGTGTAVILVRHAERAVEPEDDPPLSSAGLRRAKDLASALRTAGVVAIITSQFRRARETAAPLADSLKIQPIAIPVQADNIAPHVNAVTRAIFRHRQGVVVVIGHDVTVPAIIAALGGPHLPEICQSLFANMFILIPVNRRARLVTARYGSPDPNPGPECK